MKLCILWQRNIAIVKASHFGLKRDFFINRLLGATAGGAFLWVLEYVLFFLRGVVRRVLRVGGFGRR
jgi:hypothetical protein